MSATLYSLLQQPLYHGQYFIIRYCLFHFCFHEPLQIPHVQHGVDVFNIPNSRPQNTISKAPLWITQRGHICYVDADASYHEQLEPYCDRRYTWPQCRIPFSTLWVLLCLLAYPFVPVWVCYCCSYRHLYLSTCYLTIPTLCLARLASQDPTASMNQVVSGQAG